MIAQVIIWALVLALFGTNGGLAKVQRMAAVAKTICRFAGTHRPVHNGDVTVKSKYHSIADWNFSLWFALLSPAIGILLGILGAFLLYH
jgi:hypothetical protein